MINTNYYLVLIYMWIFWNLFANSTKNNSLEHSFSEIKLKFWIWTIFFPKFIANLKLKMNSKWMVK